MRIGIRADSSLLMGAGHFMRCLTLASELQCNGAVITWFAYQLAESQCQIINEKSIELVLLASEELAECEYRISTLPDKLDWFIIDQYSWGKDDEERIAKYVLKVLVIDDLANRPHHCDVLLDQNEFANKLVRYNGLVNPSTNQLLGCSYALLRQQFSILRNQRKTPYKDKFTILISYGGTDPTNETMKALDAINNIKWSMTINVVVVIGNGNMLQEAIEERCKQNENWTLHVQTSKMAELMYRSDIAICAGGTTTWERYCMGLPALVTVVADNQREVAFYGEQMGIDRCLGISEEVNVEHIQHQLKLLMEDLRGLEESRRIARGLVDGEGAVRVVKRMQQILNSIA